MEQIKKSLYNQDMVFTKKHTQIAKGIAILLMVYHHLFVIPERLNYDYYALPNIFGYDIQSILANFCKICVCIFVFLSGVGLYHTLSQEKSIFAMYKKVGLKALSFMMNFWVIALLVYPIGLISGYFTFDIDCIIKVIFADYSNVMEWWFVRQYIVLLILAPIFVTLLTVKSFYCRISPVFSIAFFWLTIKLLAKFGYIDINSIFYSYFWRFEDIPCILTFFVGLLITKYNLYSLFIKIPYINFISILCILTGVSCRIVFSNNPASMGADFFVVPLFVFGITTLLVNSPTSRFFEYFAKHSTNIWLTHTFWCYYFFQDIVLKPYYSVLIYIWLLFLSLLSSYLINLIYIPIYNFCFSKSHKITLKGYLFIKNGE